MPKRPNKKIPHMKALVRSRRKTYFSGEVKSITSYNDTGTFSVLPMHANFITLLKDKITIRPVDGDSIDIDIERGVARVFGNEIEVYLEG